MEERAEEMQVHVSQAVSLPMHSQRVISIAGFGALEELVGLGASVVAPVDGGPGSDRRPCCSRDRWTGLAAALVGP